MFVAERGTDTRVRPRNHLPLADMSVRSTVMMWDGHACPPENSIAKSGQECPLHVLG
jgi:hypothetical protein